MSILYAGTSVIDFIDNGALVYTSNTTASQLSADCDEGVEVRGSADTDYFYCLLDSGVTDLWIQGYFYGENNEANSFFLGLSDDSDNNIAQVRADLTSAGPINVTCGGTEVAVSASSINEAQLYKIDVHFVLHDSTGVFIVYIDDVEYINFSGDTLRSAGTSINKIKFSSTFKGTGTTTDTIWSGIIVADEDTRDMILVQNDTLSAGATNTFTSGSITDVDELGENQSDVIESASSGQQFTFTANLPTAYESGHTIVADVISCSVKKAGASGPGFLKLGYNISSTDYLDTSEAASTDFATRNRISHTDPSTASAWTVGALDGGTRVLETASS